VLALQAPVATELREVIAIKMAANELERVGDLSRNIAKGAIRVAEEDPIPIPAGLRDLASAVRDALRLALDAFGRGDPELAQSVLDRDDAIDEDEDHLIQDMLRIVRENPERAYQNIDVILVAKHLERVADHATNIAEHAIFMKEARNVKHARKLS